MEKLNALGSSLPPERSPTDQAIESLNSELSQEFKIAANAVTKLYRVANERNSLLKHRGYLQCVEDLLGMLQQERDLSVEDIHLWCLKQKSDILSHQSPGGNGKYNFDFESPGDSGSGAAATGKVPVFRLSTPPLSVEYSKPNKTMWSVQRQQEWKSVPSYHQDRGEETGGATHQTEFKEEKANMPAAPVKKQKVVSTVLTTSRRKAKGVRKD